MLCPECGKELRQGISEEGYMIWVCECGMEFDEEDIRKGWGG